MEDIIIIEFSDPNILAEFKAMVQERAGNLDFNEFMVRMCYGFVRHCKEDPKARVVFAS